MKVLIFCLAVSVSCASSLRQKESCDLLDCRAGRECVMDDGIAQCLCVISCPDHHKPVCGNDGKSYTNHCLLHQHACISNTHISIKHKGYCKDKYKKMKNDRPSEDTTLFKDTRDSMLSKNELGEKLEQDLVDSIKRSSTKEYKTEETRKGPAACFTSQRDALRYLMVGYWNENASAQSWYKNHMKPREQLWGFYYTCDGISTDGLMTPLELLECTKDVDFYPRPGQNKMETKALCIEAIIDDADKNRDAMLDFNEFAKVMNPKYQPKEKKCSSEGKSYTDGQEVNRMCNRCTCAIGSWICTPSECVEKPKKAENHVFQPNDFDNDIDVNTFTDDFRSFDIKHTKSSKDKLAFETGVNTNFDEDLENGLEFTVKDDDNVETEVKDNDTEDYVDYFDVMEKKVSKKDKYNLEKELKKLSLLEKETKTTKEIIKKLKKEKSPKKFKGYGKRQRKMKDIKKSFDMKRNKKEEKVVKEEVPWMDLIHLKNYDTSSFRKNGLKHIQKKM